MNSPHSFGLIQRLDRCLLIGFFVVLILWPQNGLAAGSWYLLYPPVRDKPRELDDVVVTSRPLREWSHQGSFDSARECDEVKERLRKFHHRKFEEETARIKNSTKRSDSALDIFRDDPLYRIAAQYAFASIAGRCVATDDPQLR